jgi:hypothetical protein
VRDAAQSLEQIGPEDGLRHHQLGAGRLLALETPDLLVEVGGPRLDAGGEERVWPPGKGCRQSMRS